METQTELWIAVAAILGAVAIWIKAQANKIQKEADEKLQTAQTMNALLRQSFEGQQATSKELITQIRTSNTFMQTVTDRLTANNDALASQEEATKNAFNEARAATEAVGKNLSAGVGIAQDNNRILGELATKVNALPSAIAEAFKPSVIELHSIVEGVNKLTNEIHQRIKDASEIEKTIETLRGEFATACQNLSDRIDALSKAAVMETEAPTIPTSPEELNGKEVKQDETQTKPD